MIELFKRKKLETIRIQDLLEEIAVETILKYRDQINQYRDYLVNITLTKL